MIKSLSDARMTDALPNILSDQDWVLALSRAFGKLHERTLQYADASQVYTEIDTASEEILDTLAVNWKIDWYDTEFPIDVKRSLIKHTLLTKRTNGTKHAVLVVLKSIFEDAELSEWFEYGGEPGTFRVVVAIPENGITAEQQRRALANIEYYKNVRSWLDIIDLVYDSRGGLEAGACATTLAKVEVWPEFVEYIDLTAQVTSGGITIAESRLEIFPTAEQEG
jgi:phage tail P2-like protein